MATPPWFRGEQAIALSAAPSHFPPSEDGRRPSVSTISRWTTAGVHGVRLRRFRATPSCWATTREEIERFQSALTALCGEAVS